MGMIGDRCGCVGGCGCGVGCGCVGGCGCGVGCGWEGLIPGDVLTMTPLGTRLLGTYNSFTTREMREN